MFNLLSTSLDPYLITKSWIDEVIPYATITSPASVDTPIAIYGNNNDSGNTTKPNKTNDEDPPKKNNYQGEIITLANAARTILPDCVNGASFQGLLPDCMGNVGVGKGDLYVIKLNFKDIYATRRLAGDFNLDETTSGGYNMAISETPGGFDVAAGCKDLSGSYPRVRYVNQQEIDTVISKFPQLTEAGILSNTCKLDMTKQYYLNVEVVASCRKDDPTRHICWGSIIQQPDQFQL